MLRIAKRDRSRLKIGMTVGAPSKSLDALLGEFASHHKAGQLQDVEGVDPAILHVSTGRRGFGAERRICTPAIILICLMDHR